MNIRIIMYYLSLSLISAVFALEAFGVVKLITLFVHYDPKLCDMCGKLPYIFFLITFALFFRFFSIPVLNRVIKNVRSA